MPEASPLKFVEWSHIRKTAQSEGSFYTDGRAAKTRSIQLVELTATLRFLRNGLFRKLVLQKTGVTDKRGIEG